MCHFMKSFCHSIWYHSCEIQIRINKGNEKLSGFKNQTIYADSLGLANSFYTQKKRIFKKVISWSKNAIVLYLFVIFQAYGLRMTTELRLDYECNFHLNSRARKLYMGMVLQYQITYFCYNATQPLCGRSSNHV